MAPDGQEEVEVTTRPRLTRDQADLLERHFQQYYKPTSNMKKELATATGSLTAAHCCKRDQMQSFKSLADILNRTGSKTDELKPSNRRNRKILTCNSPQLLQVEAVS